MYCRLLANHHHGNNSDNCSKTDQLHRAHTLDAENKSNHKGNSCDDINGAGGVNGCLQYCDGGRNY